MQSIICLSFNRSIMFMDTFVLGLHEIYILCYGILCGGYLDLYMLRSFFYMVRQKCNNAIKPLNIHKNQTFFLSLSAIQSSQFGFKVMHPYRVTVTLTLTPMLLALK